MKSNKLPYASDGVRYIIGALLLSGISIISLNAQEALKGETQEAVVMSPFEVKSTEESGYRVTDSKTATGIAMELSKTPLSIQVISVDFLEDLNLDSMNEALRYSSGIMIDEFNRDASGVRIRGFQSTTFYRNGVRRSSGPYTDSVDRVEVIKGPSSAFFGQSIPGGLINYITKIPEFKTGGDLKLSYGSYDYMKAKLDYQGVLPGYDKLAFRFIASNQDSEDWRRYNYIDRQFINGQVRWKPNSVVDLLVGYEWSESRENLLNNGRTNLQFHDDWANPPADVINHFRSSSRPTDADVIAYLQGRWNTSIGKWATDITAVRGIRPPTVTTGDLSSFYPEGRRYNTGGPGGNKLFRDKAFDVSLQLHPASWLDLNLTYNYTESFADRDQPFGFPNGDRTVPYAVTRQRISWSYQEVTSADVLLTKELGGIRHRLLFGGQIDKGSSRQGSRRIDYSSLTPVMHNGVLLTGANILRFYDPFNHPEIDTSPLFKEVNPNLSRSSSKVTGIYASYQASAFNDRLNTLISFRKEKNEDGLSGTVPSFGVNYEVIPGLTVFGSRSENFRINGPNITGAGVLPGELLPSSPPETAVGTDIGIKTSWRENSLVGTVTYFTLENSNIRRTDTQRTQYDEPRNLDNISSNNVQWFSFGGVERSEGMEIDLAWAPVRGYESVLGASYIWEAKIVSDPSRAVGTYDYEFQIGRRLGNTPKFQFKWWNKYKFSDGPLKGISVGAGLRHYGSTPGATHQPLFDEHNEAYTLIDLYVGHEAELWGHPIKTALTIENATNHKYIQGLNNTWADPRKIFLNISTKF